AMPVHESWTAGHDVRVSRGIAAPATFGSIVLLPYDYTTWSPIKRLAVLAHESAHVRRRDFYVQIAARANRALFWFNPLSWWLPRKLSEVAEALSSTFRNFMHRPVTSLPKDILAVTSARSWGLLRDRGDSILRVR
ncbi:MAG: M56 family metallopeptidase, partial [Candidatus Sulfotelmatobacter sp.]